jgi:hypothetical protein
MVVEGLETTNFWLAVIAVVSVIQILVLMGGAWLFYHLYMKTAKVANDLESHYLIPLNTRMNKVLDEAEDLADRVKDAELAVRSRFRHVADTGNVAVAAVRARSWPVVGILRGLRVAMDVLFDNWPPPRVSRTTNTRSAGGRGSTWSQS